MLPETTMATWSKRPADRVTDNLSVDANTDLIRAMREMSSAMRGANELSATAMKTAALQLDKLVRDFASLRHVAMSMHQALSETSALLMEIAPQQHEMAYHRVETALYRVHASLALARHCEMFGNR